VRNSGARSAYLEALSSYVNVTDLLLTTQRGACDALDGLPPGLGNRSIPERALPERPRLQETSWAEERRAT